VLELTEHATSPDSLVCLVTFTILILMSLYGPCSCRSMETRSLVAARFHVIGSFSTVVRCKGTFFFPYDFFRMPEVLPKSSTVTLYMHCAGVIPRPFVSRPFRPLIHPWFGQSGPSICTSPVRPPTQRPGTFSSHVFLIFVKHENRAGGLGPLFPPMKSPLPAPLLIHLSKDGATSPRVFNTFAN